MIVIVIALNFLYKDFNTTTVSLLKVGNKTIDQIQNILQSKKAKNISKQATRESTSNLAMVFRDNNTSKMKANSHKKSTIVTR